MQASHTHEREPQSRSDSCSFTDINSDYQRLGDLPKVTRLESTRVRIHSQMFPKPQPAFLPAHSTASPNTPAHTAVRSLRDPRSPRVCRGNGTPERAVMCPLLLGSHHRTEAGIQAPNSRAGLCTLPDISYRADTKPNTKL